jgi:hypothetical protein
MASVGLDALGRHKLGGVIPVGAIFRGSLKVGAAVRALRGGGHRGPSNGVPVAAARTAE